MPWYPKAVRKQLTVPNRARNKIPMPSPVRINHHTAVSNGGSIFGFFNSTGAKGVFSHFYITKDGGVEQYQNTDYRASCDLDGNPNTISIESWDGFKTGYPGYWKNSSDIPPWNDAQMKALLELDRWILDNHPTIPLKLATDNRNGKSSHGLSWHRLGVVGAPGYVTPINGGLTYSTSYGKVCPGPRRTAQVAQLYEQLRSNNSTTNPTTTTEDFFKMFKNKEEFAAFIRETMRQFYWSDKVVPGNKGVPDSSWRNNTLHVYNNTTQILGIVKALAEKSGIDVDEDALAKALTESFTPLIREAVLEAITPGATPEAIADAVAERFGSSLMNTSG